MIIVTMSFNVLNIEISIWRAPDFYVFSSDSCVTRKFVAAAAIAALEEDLEAAWRRQAQAIFLARQKPRCAPMAQWVTFINDASQGSGYGYFLPMMRDFKFKIIRCLVIAPGVMPT
ncbi:MAG: hypothetical protein M3Z96_12955, partial [Pseudomonadota bacterium]|nr:hypothetical protein [Pseudomonadota bacterium]